MMEGQQEIRQLQADEYMDTVTVYRCKFCSFISTSTDGIKGHVTSVHMRQKVFSLASAPGTAQASTPKAPTTGIQANSIAAFAAMASGAAQPAQTVSSVSQLLAAGTGISNLQEPSGRSKYLTVMPLSQQHQMPLQVPGQQNQVQIITANPPGEANCLIEMVDKSANFGNMDVGIQASESHHGNSNLVGQVDDVGQEETIQVIMEPEAVDLNDDNATHVQVIHSSGPLVMDGGVQTSDTGSILSSATKVDKSVGIERGVHSYSKSSLADKPGALQSVLQGTDTTTSGPYDQYTFTTSELGEQEGEVIDDSNVTTKELFLCGQCSTGFNSIQDCKDHMISEHSPPEQERSEYSEGQGHVSKHDASTQVENKKKPGRKKKSEMPVEEKHVPDVSDEDEDWTESLHVDLPNGRSRRKRRPPKSLKNDYYLGKTRRRVRKKTEGYDVKCTEPGCLAKFKLEETLQKHLECHIHGASVKEPGFGCLACDDRFWFWRQSRHHMWKVHEIDMDLLECPECHEFKTDTMSKLRVHMEIHGSERPYVCNICGKGFKQFAQMKNHEITHNQNGDETDKWFTSKKCEICERTFANGKCLKKHVETVHSKIKPFQCAFCDHACSRKAMLMLHIRTHTNEKPFKCDVCAYMTGDHNSLRRHKMRHTGQKPYKCPHCAYACIQAISLKVHLKNKHVGQEGVYNCNLCLFRTINKQQFINHQLDHKNGLIDMENVYPNPRPVPKKVKVKEEDTSAVALDDLVGQITTQGEIATVEMEVPTEGDKTNIIADESGEKLISYEGNFPPDITAAQLIYSALNAISQNNQQSGSQSKPDADSENKTTHTITFHIPQAESGAEELSTGNQLMLQPVEVIAMEDVMDGSVQICQTSDDRRSVGDVQDSAEYAEIIPETYQEQTSIVIQSDA